jgi:hypothetical protein
MSEPCPSPERWKEHLEGTLADTEQVLLTAHLDRCADCRKTLEKLAAGSDSLLDVARQAGDATVAATPALRDVIEQFQAPPAQTQDAPGAGDDSLSFLTPSQKPGHLGRLGHYEVQEVIGKGGFGIVLKAFDEKLHRVVAIKVLSPAYAAIGSARKRFIREARAAAAVKNEHVVAIYNVQDEEQPPYLVMELIDGISLQDKLDKHGPCGVKEILRIGMQMSEGLTAAHKQGLVHRDIKPANILLENGVERVKITDFGLARAVDDASVTQSGTVAGTPMYMSPEQAEGLAIDHRSDLFSLGTVLYAMCTGHPPFRASGTHAVLKRVIDAAPRPIREINPEIPDWLADIITKLHAKKPSERFQTAKEVAELLGQHLAHLQQPTQVAPPTPVTTPAPVVSQQHKSVASVPARVWWGAGLCAFGAELFLFGMALREDTWNVRTALLMGHALLACVTLAVCWLCFALRRAARHRGALRLAQAAILCGVLSAACAVALVAISLLTGFLERRGQAVTLAMDDPAIVVRIWPTLQTEPPLNLAGPVEILGNPTHVIQHRTTMELLLPAGNYWLTAELHGVEVHRVFMKIGQSKKHRCGRRQRSKANARNLPVRRRSPGALHR